MNLIDILLNLDPGIYVEFSRPFEKMPDHVLVRCRRGIWAKDILVDTRNVCTSVDHALSVAVKEAMESIKRK